MSQLKFLNARIKQTLLQRRVWIKRRTILWMMLGIITVAISGLVFAPFEPVVYLTGQLKTQETIQKILLPKDSIIQEVYVQQGEEVKKGQTLLSFNVINSLTKLKNLETLQQSLQEENQFYKNVINRAINAEQGEKTISKLRLSQEKMALVQSKIDLIEENQRLKEQVNQNKKQVAIKIQELEKLESGKPNSSSSASLSSKEKLQQRMEQIKNQLNASQNQLTKEQKVLEQVKNLLDQKAVTTLEYIDQQGKVKERQDEINKLRLELETLQSIFEPPKEDVEQLIIQKNKKNLLQQISQQQDQIILMQKTLISKEEKLTQIDEQLNKYIVENQVKITNVNHQIQQYKKQIRSIELISTLSGQVTKISLKNNEGLQITSKPELMAEVFIPYENRQLIRENQKIEVIIDDLKEKGFVSGKIVSIGSDLLFPNQLYPFYRLPVNIKLEKKAITSHNQEIVLKSGMRVTVKSPVEQKRTVLKVFYQNILFKINQIQHKGGI